MLIVLIILLLQNKEFFIWCSLLVEAGYFSNITVGFLIVGHTHASIDQYFSCLRRKIRNASFIGSPIALQYLFSLPSTTEDEKKNKSLYRPPISQIQLYFVRDYKSLFAPYYNPKIVNYNIPYQFKFFRVMGKCACQYQMFKDDKLPFLPLIPLEDWKSLERLLSHQLFAINATHSLSAEAGVENFSEHLQLTSTIESSSLGRAKTKDDLERMVALNDVVNDLKDLEQKAMGEQVLRHADEADGIDDIERYDDDAVRDAALLYQKSFQGMNSKTHGNENLTYNRDLHILLTGFIML